MCTPAALVAWIRFVEKWEARPQTFTCSLDFCVYMSDLLFLHSNVVSEVRESMRSFQQFPSSLRGEIAEFLGCADQIRLDATCQRWTPVRQTYNVVGVNEKYLPLHPLTSSMILHRDHVLAWCFRGDREPATAIEIPLVGTKEPTKEPMSWVKFVKSSHLGHRMDRANICTVQCDPWLICTEAKFAAGDVMPIHRFNYITKKHEMDPFPVPCFTDRGDVDLNVCYSPWSDEVFQCSLEWGVPGYCSVSISCLKRNLDVIEYEVDDIWIRDDEKIHRFCIIDRRSFFLTLSTSFLMLRLQNNRFSVWWRKIREDPYSSVRVFKSFISVAADDTESHKHRSLRIFDLCGREVTGIEDCPAFGDWTLDDHRLLLYVDDYVVGVLYKFPSGWGQRHLNPNKKRKQCVE